MKVVLDSAGILNFRNLPEGDYITTAEVKEEIKDIGSKLLLEARKIKTMLPSKESLKKAEKTAEKTGDIKKLSRADLSVIALCIEIKDCILITDDYSVQNTAKELGIKYKGVLFGEIKEKRKYRMKCPSCAREFSASTEECSDCGAKLKRIKFI